MGSGACEVDQVVAGVPDLAVIAHGKAHFIEVKTIDGRLSEAQRDTIAKLETIGAPVALASSIDDARAAFRAWGIETREVKK